VGGASIFEWGGGSTSRIVRVLNAYGGLGLVEADRVDGEFAAVFQEMPAWPDHGSVRVEDGVVLIKLPD
jgi:hypothetical protein